MNTFPLDLCLISKLFDDSLIRSRSPFHTNHSLKRLKRRDAVRSNRLIRFASTNLRSIVNKRIRKQVVRHRNRRNPHAYRSRHIFTKRYRRDKTDSMHETHDKKKLLIQVRIPRQTIRTSCPIYQERGRSIMRFIRRVFRGR